MRITMVTSSLGSGGAERVMVTMANWWAARGREVTIVTLADTPSFYPLDGRVRHVGLGVRGASGSPLRAAVANGRRLVALRRALRGSGPDVVVSFLTASNVQTILSAWGIRAGAGAREGLPYDRVGVIDREWTSDQGGCHPPLHPSGPHRTGPTSGQGALEGLPYGDGGRPRRGVPVVVEEHSDPTMEGVHPAWRSLRRVAYPWAARVLVLSEVARDHFPDVIRRNTEIMPNPILVEPAGDGLRRPTRGGRRQVVSMGRFTGEKGFDRLLDAFAALAPEHPDWDLVVWGDGPLRGELEAQAARLGIGGRVRMPGRTTAPHDRLREGDLYALPSRREGFPMALGEAMGCGLPAVAFDLPSGPKALIRDGVDGVLVPNGDVGAFAGALGSLMRDDARRLGLAARAPEVLDRYGVDAVMGRWERLLADVTSGGGRAR